MITPSEIQSFLIPKKSKTGFTRLRPSTPIKDVPLHMLPYLLAVMKDKAKPITKRSAIRYVLSSVGKDAFERLRVKNGWESLKYVRISGIRIECTSPAYLHDEKPCRELDHVEFPF